MTAPLIDLDAGRRELAHPDGIPVVLGGETFTLPAEFPVDVLDPFLDEKFDLAGLIREAVRKSKNEDGTTKPVSVIVVDTLFDRPSLPVELIQTIYAAFEQLFGAEDYARFKAQRPSIGDYQRLTSGLFSLYGVSLGEAFASPDSSESDGATQKETSAGSTESTPAKSGAGKGKKKGSSE